MLTPRKILCIFALLFGNYFFSGTTASFAEKREGYAIIPKPVKIKSHVGSFPLTRTLSIVPYDDSDDVRDLAIYLGTLIKKETNRTPMINAASTVQPRRQLVSGAIILSLREYLSSLGGEGYTLRVTPDSVVIASTGPSGLFYGIQTLSQMMHGRKSLPCVEIEDMPRFKWRGMLLDCSRRFFSVDFVKRYIDFLAYHKMNVLHLHLTDDQGWRIEVKQYPRLTEIGAWRQYDLLSNDDSLRTNGDEHYGGFYTQEEMRDIIAYAQSRYVMIIPEIEMPGHCTAALASYPEFSCTGESLSVSTRISGDKNIFCAGKEDTFLFLENILTEICDLFPAPYVHIGGDEADKSYWNQCPLCQNRITNEGLKDENELQSWFIRRIDDFLKTKGKTLIGWDEILEGGVSPNAVVQSWRIAFYHDLNTQDINASIINQGHALISSPFDYTYLICGQEKEQAGPKWNRHITLKQIYSFEPVSQGLSSEQAKYILGAECCMWTELTKSPGDVDWQVFPRLCAFSEVVWSPSSTRNFSDFSHRLKYHYKRLDSLGIKYYKK